MIFAASAETTDSVLEKHLASSTQVRVIGLIWVASEIVLIGVASVFAFKVRRYRESGPRWWWAGLGFLVSLVAYVVVGSLAESMVPGIDSTKTMASFAEMRAGQQTPMLTLLLVSLLGLIASLPLFIGLSCQLRYASTDGRVLRGAWWGWMGFFIITWSAADIVDLHLALQRGSEESQALVLLAVIALWGGVRPAKKTSSDEDVKLEKP